MAVKKKNSKTKKVLLIIIGIIIILITVISIGVGSYIEGKVKTHLNQQFNNNPESMYRIELEAAGINIFNGAIQLENLIITPKDFATDSLDKAKIKSLVQTKIVSFDLKGLKIIQFFNDQTLDIRKISIEGAEVNYIINPDKKSKKRNEPQALSNIFSDAFKGAMVGEIEIQNTNIKFSNNDHVDDPWFEIDSLSISLSNIEFDEATTTQFIPLTFSNLTIDTKHFSIKSLQYYDVSTAEIILNLQDSTLFINGFEFLPTLSKKAYNKQIPYEADLYSFKIEQIKLNGFDIKDILINNRIFLSSIEIHKLYADIYRDKTVTDPPYKEKPLFASIVRKIPLKTAIDSLLIYDSKLNYEEKQKLSDIPGQVNFDKLNIKVYNITNDIDRLQLDHHLPINIDGRLMSEGNIKVWIKVDLNSHEDAFKATGLLGPISGIAFNKLTKHLLLAEIEMGSVKSAWFSYNANNEESLGELKIDYENLKMQAYKVDKEKKAKFLTFIGNNLIRKSNLPEDPKYRTGVVSFKRSKDKGIPNFLWKSVQSGIISIIAPVAENKKQREITKKNKKDKRQKKKNNKKSKK